MSRRGAQVSFVGRNMVDDAIEDFLTAIEAGVPVEDAEGHYVDAKEEPGRRNKETVTAGPADLEATAGLLYPELACMGNTRGGGAIVLGLAKDGRRPGATVDPDMLRRRIYELSGRLLTITADRHVLRDGSGLLILRVPEQLEPVRVDGVINWRYGDSCQEVDPSTWHATIGLRGRDWSREPAPETIDDVDEDAVAAIRHFLRASGEPARVELAELQRDELLRRLPNLLADAARLTRAGRLLLTRLDPALSYVHRDRHGGDSTIRLETSDPLLVQLRAILAAIEARGRVTHVESSTGATGQFAHLPMRAAREAIVNGICHRDWHAHATTSVEHVGESLRVTSPGDLVGSVTVDNILTHRSEPRYPALAEALTHIRVAEREGIGVDRMYGDMLAIGHPPPQITNGDGAVEVVLLGGPPSAGWISLRTQADALDGDERPADDLRNLLALHAAARAGWVSPTSLATTIQTTPAEAGHALDRAARLTIAGVAALSPIDGRPHSLPPAFRLSPRSVELLAEELAPPDDITSRAALLVAYAQDAGRVSSTEACHLLDVSSQTAIDALNEAEQNGDLRPSREQRRGRGFHYVPSLDP